MPSLRRFLRSLQFIAACLLATSCLAVRTVSAAGPYGPPLLKAPALLIDAAAGNEGDYETVRAVSVGDVNGDGYPDIAAHYAVAVGQTVTNKMAFLHFHKIPGSPTLFDWPSTPLGYEAGPSPGPDAAKIGNLNYDGRADLARIDAGGGAVRVQVSNPFGFNPSEVYPMDPGVVLRGLELADMDGDGLVDIMVFGTDPNQAGDLVLMLHNSGSGAMQVMTPWALRMPYVAGITIGDLNGDSRPDVVTWNGSASVAMHLNDGSFSYLPPVTLTAASVITDAAIGKMDGDAMADLALVHGASLAYLSIHHGTLSGTPTSAHDSHLAAYGLGYVTAADIDNNGTVELYASESWTDGNPPTSAGMQGKIVVINPSLSPVHLFDRAFLSPGRKPGKVVAADLDRDGTLDLVVPLGDAPEQDVAVLFGPVHQNKGIQLEATGSVALPGSPAVGDWNRDGRPDLALSVGAGTFTWLGSGGGAFTGGTSTTALSSDRLHAADMNRDGRLDLIHSGPTDFGLQLGNGDGTFQAMTTLANAGARSVARPLVDMNRDGKLDLIWINSSGLGRMGVVMGNGAGTLSGSVNFYMEGFNGTPHDVAAGDLDLDGDLDLAVATAWGIRLLNCNGVSTYTSFSDLEDGEDYRVITTGDVDRDGDLDLVACHRVGAPFNRTVEGIDILYLDGAMNLVQKVSLGAAERLGTMVAVADVNRDGIPDIVCTSENDQALDPRPSVSSVFVQSPPGVFQQRLDFAQGYVRPDGFSAFADADGDRQPDIVSTNVSWSGAAPYLQVVQAGAPVGTWGVAGQQDFASTGFPYGLACGDMNRDGKPDLVSGGYGGIVRVLFGDGDGAFAVPGYTATTGGVTDLALADFNRDGRLDVVTANEGGGVTLLLGEVGGTLAAPVVSSCPGPIRHVRVADFNRDGRPDVVAFGWPMAAYVFLTSADGLVLSQTVSIPGPGYGAALSVGDFNRDGADDIAAAYYDNAPVIVVAFGAGDGTFGAASTVWSQQSLNIPSGMAAADVNVDGKMDLIVAMADGGTWPFIVLYGDGSGGFPSEAAYPSTSNESDYFAIGYLDGDKWPDIVQSGLGGMSVRLGNGAGGFGPRSDPGLYSSATGVVIADLDRDGMNDIAYNDNGAEVTSVLLNSKANITAVSTSEAAPRAARPTLAQNAPNPFNPRTTISFVVPTAGPARLVVYDVQGRRVACLVDRVISAGAHRVDWDGRDAAGRSAASGVYLYRLESAGRAVSRRMVLVK